jgi:sigma-B regulation protein RsbU (phosphoserine phosphatase)
VRPVKLDDNRRIGLLVQMVREISVAESPLQVLTAFARYYWELRPTDYMISLSTKDLPEGQYRITRQIDVGAVRAGQRSMTEEQRWPDRSQIPVHQGGFLGEIIARKRPQLFHHLDLKGDPVLGDALAGLGSAMVMPLYDEGEPRYWNIPFRRAPEGFTVEELEQAMLVANLAGGTNSRLLLVQEIKKLNQTLRQQFEEVAQVQRSLLPRQTPDIPGLEIATSYLTSEQAGGDYYDFFRFPDGRWGILIADVSGHGAAAATVMAMFHGILHAYSGPSCYPDEVLRYANTRLLAAGIEGTFVTAFLGIYDPRDGSMSYARSGHNPPILKDGRTGAVTFLEGAGGLPLGVFDPYEIASDTLHLKPMDTVVLYTDGITEAFNAQREMFGPHRLDEALTHCTGAPDCVVDSVHSALFKHTGSLSRRDDQTLVAVRYRGAS